MSVIPKVCSLCEQKSPTHTIQQAIGVNFETKSINICTCTRCYNIISKFNNIIDICMKHERERNRDPPK